MNCNVRKLRHAISSVYKAKIVYIYLEGKCYESPHKEENTAHFPIKLEANINRQERIFQ